MNFIFGITDQSQGFKNFMPNNNPTMTRIRGELNKDLGGLDLNNDSASSVNNYKNDIASKSNNGSSALNNRSLSEDTSTLPIFERIVTSTLRTTTVHLNNNSASPVNNYENGIISKSNNGSLGGEGTAAPQVAAEDLFGDDMSVRSDNEEVTAKKKKKRAKKSKKRRKKNGKSKYSESGKKSVRESAEEDLYFYGGYVSKASLLAFGVVLAFGWILIICAGKILYIFYNESFHLHVEHSN